MKTTFVDAGDERLNEDNPYVKLRDKGLPKELRSDEALHTALFRYIVKAYNDPPSSDETASVMGWTQACLKTVINNVSSLAPPKSTTRMVTNETLLKVFEFTGQDDHYVLYHEIWSALDALGLTVGTFDVIKGLRNIGGVGSGDRKRTRSGKQDRYLSKIKII